MSVLLRVDNLKVHFRVRRGFLRTVPVKAVDGVSLSLHRGETVAVVGESGSGKTTLGRATLRLLLPTAGRVVFDGQDVARLSEGQLKSFRRRAQAIFQDPYASINPYMTVYEVVEEPLVIHGVGSRRERRGMVLGALEQVKLIPGQEFAAKYPHHLSGGQRQRVSIARALVLRPDYILADEPVSMIDASSRAEILYLLRELQERHGIAFLYITHDIASARHFSDRIAVMYLGTLVEVGPPARVIEEPHHPYTRALIAAVPEPDPENRRRLRPVIPGEPPAATHVPLGCPFTPRCPQVIAGTCAAIRPRLQEVSADQLVACHLYETGAAAQTPELPAAGDDARA